MLRLGSRQWEIYKKGEQRPSQPMTNLRDRFTARQWLQQFKGNALSMSALRRLLERRSSLGWQLDSFNDDDVIEQAAELLAAGIWHVHEGELLRHLSDTQGVSADSKDKGSAAPAESKATPARMSAANQVSLAEPRTSKSSQSATAAAKKLTWIEIELVDDDGHPVAGAAYEVKLTDGSTRKGSLDKNGRARVDDIPPGMCSVYFPEFDAREWARTKS